MSIFITVIKFCSLAKIFKKILLKPENTETMKKALKI